MIKFRRTLKRIRNTSLIKNIYMNHLSKCIHISIYQILYFKSFLKPRTFEVFQLQIHNVYFLCYTCLMYVSQIMKLNPFNIVFKKLYFYDVTPFSSSYIMYSLYSIQSKTKCTFINTFFSNDACVFTFFIFSKKTFMGSKHNDIKVTIIILVDL